MGRARALSFLVSCWLLAFAAAAQQAPVAGQVLDADAHPLPGVSVRVKHSNRGVISDADGRFRLPAAPADTLVFTFVGHEAAELPAGSGTGGLTVRLRPDTRQLQEVVVTSLGIQKARADLTFASQGVRGQDLLKAREPNPINALAGKVAGLSVGASPEMLRAPQVLLRGGRPLYVVDGVPIVSDTWNINPDDIESYEVIKGPSGSALYGSRATNGVIMITTRKGTRDGRGFSVELNSSTMLESGFLAIPRVQDLYGPGDHGKYAFVDGRGGGVNDGDYDGGWGPKFEGQLIPQYDSPVDPVTGKRTPTPWLARGKDNLSRFLQTGLINATSVAFSASTDRSNLRVGLSNQYQRGIVPNTGLNNLGLSLTLGQRFSERVRFESNFNFSRQSSQNYPDVNYGPNSMIYNMVLWAGSDWSVDDMKNYWQPGREGIQQLYAEYQRYNNPWFMVKEWLRGHYNTSYNGYTLLRVKLAQGLELQGRTQLTGYELFRSEKMPVSATTYGREEALGDYREDRRSLLENNTDVLLDYSRTLGRSLTLKAIAGVAGRFFTYNSNYASTDYLNVPGVYNFNNSRNPVRAFNYNAAMQVLSGLYSLDLGLGRYANLTATGRWDKNSTLPAGRNVFFYPSVGVSTVLSEYLTLPGAMSFLKLRASYANVKDAFIQQSIGTAYDALGQGNPMGYGMTYSSPYDGPSYGTTVAYSTPRPYNNQAVAYYANRLVDPTLTPSSRTNFEAGLDVRFVRNRIGLDVTWFRYLDGPRIFSLTLPEATGYSSLTTNGIKTSRSGLEVVLTGQVLQRPTGLSWETVVNWSTYQERLREIYGTQQRLDQFYKVGDRLDAYYGRSFLRTPQGQLVNDPAGYPIYNPVPRFLGFTNPDWSFGFINKFRFKKLFLNVQLDGRVGGVIENYVQKQTFRGGRHIATVQGQMGLAREQDYKGVKSWVGPGVVLKSGKVSYDVDGNVLNYGELAFEPMGDSQKTFLQDWISRYYNTNEANIISRSFVKLREVTLGYSLPVRGFIRSAEVALVGRNLLYFAAKKDIDVEQFVSYGDRTSTLQTPVTRRYGLNINLVF